LQAAIDFLVKVFSVFSVCIRLSPALELILVRKRNLSRWSLLQKEQK
jgi:hypothetical protein